MSDKKNSEKEKYVIKQQTSTIVFSKNIVYWFFDDKRLIQYKKESFYIPLDRISAITYGKVRKLRKSILLFSLLPLFFLMIWIVKEDSERWLPPAIILIFVLFFVFKVWRFLIIKSANNEIEIKIESNVESETQDFIEAINQEWVSMKK